MLVLAALVAIVGFPTLYVMVAWAVIIGLASVIGSDTAEVYFAAVAGLATVLLIVVLVLIVGPGTVTLVVAVLVVLVWQKKKVFSLSSRFAQL